MVPSTTESTPWTRLRRIAHPLLLVLVAVYLWATIELEVNRGIAFFVAGALGLV